ncbi:four helix bundle protein [Maribacter aurantiacus]|uniref:Four helix bundle protein n=1 Tax=Maribacter aurantiacus TaxID=1882343 RepID=A0A5R8M727_9FLAO|nr:four helix bundle protein [Maribacter aurantiacus]TLF44569.1 four helix bundle protein [Maribacter aurantiacus]
MGKNVIKEKSFEFGVKIVRLSKALNSQSELVISRQLLRSGTAVGALIREAEFGESKADFAHKMNISLKQANETLYWLDLLVAAELLNEDNVCVEKSLSKEIIPMLVSTLKTIRK